jgi:hypothetical protein
MMLVINGQGGGKWHIPFVRTSYVLYRALHIDNRSLGCAESVGLGDVSFVYNLRD